MDTDANAQVGKIMADMDCSSGFDCYGSGQVNRDKVRDIGADGVLDCLEQDWPTQSYCKYSLSFERGYLCQCPLQLYAAGKHCIHHWDLERPSGESTHGKCRKCGAEKDFPSTPATKFSMAAAIKKIAASPTTTIIQ